MSKQVNYSKSDRQGNSRDVSFIHQDGLVVQRLKKNGRVTHDIKYSEQGFQEVVESVLDTHAQMEEKRPGSDLPFDPEMWDSSTESKLELVGEILDTLSAREVEELKVQDNSQYLDSELLKDIVQEYKPNKDNEKIKEDVLQLMYEEYGFDWFTMPEFREVYNVNYTQSKAYRYIQQIEDPWLNKKTIPEEEREGNTKYKYKLGSQAQQVIQEYGAFDSMQYPVYRKKSREYK